MKNKKYLFIILLVLLVFIGVLLMISTQKKSQKLFVTFFDVGQGDAILISQGDQQMLIDGGRDGGVLLERLGSTMPFWDRTIETVAITHPDQDHIGGLIALLQTYTVGSVLETRATNDSQAYKKLEELIAQSEVQKIEAMQNVSVKFAGGGQGNILYPFGSVLETSQTNENSVVLKLSFGENTFLFTGDLPLEQEKELAEKSGDLKSHVLKVGHHGSKNSSSDEFLLKVSPDDAIISVGKNNTYGHPAQEALERLRAHGANIFRTDEQGTVTYVCAPSERCVIR